MEFEQEVKEKIAEIGKAHKEYKESNDLAMKEIREKGTVDPLLEEKLKKINDDLDIQTKSKETLEKAQEELKTAMNRMNIAAEKAEDDGKDSKELKTAFHGFIRKGKENEYQAVLEKEMEGKDLSVGVDPDGGYYVRPELSSRIISKVFESSPLRELSAVETISTDALEMSSDLNEAGFGWVGENAARPTTTTPQIGMIRIPVHELYASPKATQKLLDDAAFDVEGWLARKVSSKFARVEATAFVAGDGVTKPRGLLTYPNGTTGQTVEQINSTVSGAPTADSILDLFYALKEPYAGNSVWLMQRLVVREVRQLKDGQGRYLWQPGLIAGEPNLLARQPVRQANDMEAAAADSLSIALGDWKEAYQVVDRLGIRVLRDPFTDKPHVVFYTTKRVGGDVVNFEALKIMKFAA